MPRDRLDFCQILTAQNILLRKVQVSMKKIATGNRLSNEAKTT